MDAKLEHCDNLRREIMEDEVPKDEEAASDDAHKHVVRPPSLVEPTLWDSYDDETEHDERQDALAEPVMQKNARYEYLERRIEFCRERDCKMSSAPR